MRTEEEPCSTAVRRDDSLLAVLFLLSNVGHRYDLFVHRESLAPGGFVREPFQSARIECLVDGHACAWREKTVDYHAVPFECTGQRERRNETARRASQLVLVAQNTSSLPSPASGGENAR